MKRTNLKVIRIRKHLLQKDLATKVGVTTQTISDFENGKLNPSYDTMKKISTELNATVDELFFSKN